MKRNKIMNSLKRLVPIFLLALILSAYFFIRAETPPVNIEPDYAFYYDTCEVSDGSVPTLDQDHGRCTKSQGSEIITEAIKDAADATERAKLLERAAWQVQDNLVITLSFIVSITYFVFLFFLAQKTNAHTKEGLSTINFRQLFDFIRKANLPEIEEKRIVLANHVLNYKLIGTERIQEYIKELQNSSKANFAAALVPSVLLIVFFFVMITQLLITVGAQLEKAEGPTDIQEITGLTQLSYLTVFVGVFLQTLAFFLLRSYRRTRADIRYFQNELSNIEFWYGSLSIALLVSDDNCAKEILTKVSELERNSIIKEGKRLYPDEEDTGDNASSILNAIAEAIKPSNPN